jgi:hypothetical protein
MHYTLYVIKLLKKFNFSNCYQPRHPRRSRILALIDLAASKGSYAYAVCGCWVGSSLGLKPEINALLESICLFPHKTRTGLVK